LNRKGLFVLGIIISAFFAVSLSSSVFAAEWLFYDDGDADGGVNKAAGDYLAVRFTPPCSNAKILTVRFYVYDRDDDAANVILHILAADRSTELLTPNPTITLTTGQFYWFDYDVSAADVYVSDDFYVALEWILDTGDPYIGYDNEAPYYSRSLDRVSGAWTTYGDVDWLIRALIDCQGEAQPVGGDIFRIDKLSLLTPYFLVALAIATTTLILIKKRKN